MKYTTEQNVDHWLRALDAAHYGDTFGPPNDCPQSRWKSLVREAKLSLPSLKEAVDKHVRSTTKSKKHIISIAK